MTNKTTKSVYKTSQCENTLRIDKIYNNIRKLRKTANDNTAMKLHSKNKQN